MDQEKELCGYLLLLFAYTRRHEPLRQAKQQDLHDVFYRVGWEVQFLEAGLKTPLPRTFTFTEPEKILELARRGEAWGTSEARQMLELAIEQGRGGCYLRLTPGQYAKLRGRTVDGKT
jgi:hypothetical protein